MNAKLKPRVESFGPFWFRAPAVPVTTEKQQLAGPWPAKWIGISRLPKI
jgi:hypothetical protein